MFCVCMPCDNNNIASLHVYVDILTQISAICSKYDAEYICIGGDMNTDLVRLQSQNTQALIQFASKESLQSALNHSISDITHTFTSFAIDSFSTIDHFIVTSSLYQAIKSYTTCDDVMNQSDHLPLFISIDIEVPTGTLDNSTVIKPFSTVRAQRQLWDHAVITDRVECCTRLDHNLCLLHLPRDYCNCNCTDY